MYPFFLYIQNNKIMISFQTYLCLLTYELKVSSIYIKSQCIWKYQQLMIEKECICHPVTEYKKQRQQFFLWCFMQMCLIFTSIKLSEGYASCIMQWASATPSPNPVIITPNSFIFSHSPFHFHIPLSSLSWQTEHYFRDLKLFKYLNQFSCLFKHGICRRWALEICFQNFPRWGGGAGKKKKKKKKKRKILR